MNEEHELNMAYLAEKSPVVNNFIRSVLLDTIKQSNGSWVVRDDGEYGMPDSAGQSLLWRVLLKNLPLLHITEEKLRADRIKHLHAELTALESMNMKAQVRKGWRVFECDYCQHKWESKCRDCMSPSTEPCPKCSELNPPIDMRLDATIPTDSLGNLPQDNT